MKSNLNSFLTVIFKYRMLQFPLRSEFLSSIRWVHSWWRNFKILIGLVTKFYNQTNYKILWLKILDISKELGIFLIAGSIPEIKDDKLFNTSTIWGPQGNLLATYRKLHLFDIDIPGMIQTCRLHFLILLIQISCSYWRRNHFQRIWCFVSWIKFKSDWGQWFQNRCWYLLWYSFRRTRQTLQAQRMQYVSLSWSIQHENRTIALGAFSEIKK